MKLYYSPGACSLSPHIALEESGLPYEAIAAPTKTHQLADGTDYYSINPLGYVPLLVLNDGRQLREGPAIVQYIADQVPAKKLAPANGTFERAKLHEWLNFIGTELHKGFSPLFNPATPAEYKTMVIAKLGERLKFTDGLLSDRQFVLGDTFSVADGYLFTVTNWAQPLNIDLAPYSNLVAYRARVAARPAVVRAMQAEGLIK
ncbi:MAG: glutathione transferase GstA [Pseudomonadales bacterium RIFCSPLOWO2_12_59_9]|uniref:glutathione transferase GstA n=1 Tax=Pseudomonas sp. TaxID=306 RepID=UPI0008C7A824|nr:MAG: glutathione transferase GstA [Pseudomonadales bacterium RIFCSPLOWO2_12_59_9]